MGRIFIKYDKQVTIMSQIKKDFIFKLFTNVIRIPVSFILQSIYPRLLGPVAYGNFDFLNDFANKIINFLDGGVSVGFYTKLSQDKTNKSIIKFYFRLLMIISIIYMLFILTTFLFNFYSIIWPGQYVKIIFLSSLLAVVTFFSNALLRMIDACEQTIKGEIIKVGQLIISVVIIFLFYILFKTIELSIFYIIQIFLVIILFISLGVVLHKAGFSPIQSLKLSKEQISALSKYFWTYSSPLLASGIIGLLTGIGERWILQVYGGSIQQGFFALSYKISTFVFLFTSAMMPLLMREISKYFATNDQLIIKNIFFKNIKILYFLVCFMSVYVYLNADFITLILGGKNFSNAGIIVGLMAFYPIHQTIGQINATLYMSTNRTIAYRNISLIFSPTSILLSYILIAPTTKYGLGLGAKGLVYEMIIIQFITQNTLLFFNCRYLNSSFTKLFIHQIIILLGMFIIGYFILKFLIIFISNKLIISLFHFLILLIIIVFGVFFFPKLIGLNDNEELKKILKIN